MKGFALEFEKIANSRSQQAALTAQLRDFERKRRMEEIEALRKSQRRGEGLKSSLRAGGSAFTTGALLAALPGLLDTKGREDAARASEEVQSLQRGLRMQRIVPDMTPEQRKDFARELLRGTKGRLNPRADEFLATASEILDDQPRGPARYPTRSALDEFVTAGRDDILREAKQPNTPRGRARAFRHGRLHRQMLQKNLGWAAKAAIPFGLAGLVGGSLAHRSRKRRADELLGPVSKPSRSAVAAGGRR